MNRLRLFIKVNMRLTERKTLERIRRSADKIGSIKDLRRSRPSESKVPESPDISQSQTQLIILAQEVFINRYLPSLRKQKIDVYATREYPHSVHSNIKVTPHLIRDDGVVIYFNIRSSSSDSYLLRVPKNIIHLTMNILKIKKSIIYTLHVDSDSPSIKSIETIEEKEVAYVPHKAADYIKTLVRKKRCIGSNQTEIDLDDSDRMIKGFDPSKWISASKTRNFALNDTLVDWLEFNERSGSSKSHVYQDESDDLSEEEFDAESSEDMPNVRQNSTNAFDSFVMNKGIEFERKVVNLLKSKVDDADFKTICLMSKSFHQSVLSYEKLTIKAMKKGIPFIYQPLLMNRTGTLSYSYGIPDLLVRSDYLDIITSDNPYDKFQTRINAPKLGRNPYHYVVVDIKYTTLELCSDGKRIRNSGSFPAYKCQLYIYNRALGQIQGYEPHSSFILGRKYRYSSQGQNYEGSSCFDKLGHIMYGSWDNSFVDEAIGAVKWIQRLRSDGSNWKLYPKPSVNELYPNMCAPSDSKWYSFKEKYARDIGEITLLWNCGTVHRSIARENGIRSFRDSDCSSSELGIRGICKAPVLDSIISINQKIRFKTKLDRIDLTLNPLVDNRWAAASDLRISVDFETISNLFDDFKNLPLSSNTNYLFLIGLSYIYKGEEPVYEFFMLSELSKIAETHLIIQFYDFLRKITTKYLGRSESIPALTHWGHIERTHFRKICQTSSTDLSISKSLRTKVKLISGRIEFDDLAESFKRNPIVLNGCFKFGLKEIAKRMHELGLIRSSWDSHNPCSNGNSAMFLAHQAYRRKSKLLSDPHVKNIIEYNRIDCQVLHEIVDVLLQKIE